MKTATKEIFDRLHKNNKIKQKIQELQEEYCEVEEEETSNIVDDIRSTIYDEVLSFAKEFLIREGVPDDYEGWVFALDQENDAEILLVKTKNKKYIPSVSSPCWEAKANCIDEDCAVDTPEEALAWGLSDAIANYFANAFNSVRSSYD